MMGRRRTRRANINSALGQHLVLVGRAAKLLRDDDKQILTKAARRARVLKHARVHGVNSIFVKSQVIEIDKKQT